MKTIYEANGNEVNILQDSDIKGDEGYVQYPDGTMILYGVGKIENTGEASIHINFPKNFMDSGYSVSIQNIFSYNFFSYKINIYLTVIISIQYNNLLKKIESQ